MSFDIVEIGVCLGDIETSPSILFEDDDGRIAQKTGISKIHRSSVSAYDLAVQATMNLKCISSIKSQLKYVIYVTQSPSYFLPNHAARLQNDLKISQEAMCFDMNQGCSGFVQALLTMLSLTGGTEDLGLVVCTDTYSKHLSSDDRSTQVLFSDGATATVIKGGGKWELVGSKHLTDGSGADLLSKTVDESNRLKMDGASVFQWTRRELGKQIRELLAAQGLDIHKIDRFYLHQASKLVLTNVMKSLSVSANIVPTTLPITGNLVSSSIPFLLKQDINEFNNSKLLVISGFGVGLSCSSCIIRKKCD